MGRFVSGVKKIGRVGVLTRGAYVQGMSSVQFTTRELSESIRQPLPVLADSRSTVLSSADPANPFGLLIDWPEGGGGVSYARKPGNFLVLHGAHWRLWIENNGKRVFSLTQPDISANTPSESEDESVVSQAAILKSAFQDIIRQRKLVKIKVDSWNGEPIAETAIGRQLLKIGAEKDLRSLVLWSN